MTNQNVNVTAGSVRKLTTGTSAGKFQATAILGEGRGATKRTKTFAREHDAKRWLADVRAAGLAHGAASDRTLAQSVDAYVDGNVLAPNTVQVFQALRRHVVASGLGDVRLAKLKPSSQRQFAAWMTRRGYAASTVNLHAAKLTSVLRYAAADGGLSFTPKTAKVDDRRGDAVALTPGDVRALYEAATDNFAPAILLGAFCGLRASEVAAVTVGDVDWSAGTVSVSKAIDRHGAFVRTKTARSVRTVPVPANVLDQLQAHRFRPESEPLARNEHGGFLATSVFAATFRKTADRAGLADVTSHALRKFFATSMLSAGVNPKAVARWLGDSVETMLATYALTRHDDADAGRAAIAAAFDATAAA